jgi:sulfonate transport system ATP-binding protein
VTAQPQAVTGSVRVRGLSKRFGDTEVLAGLDLDIAPGEIVALVGASGSGKSTLLRVLAGLSGDHTGDVEVPAERAVAFQEARLFPWRRTLANVLLGVPPGTLARAEARRRALDVLTEVGLTHRLDAWPLTLSGGEAQRVALARALVGSPRLLLLDEPFGALDALTRITAQHLLLQLWQRHGFAVLLVTHDVNEAVNLADRVLVLEEGRLGHEVAVDLPRPRPHGSPEVALLAARLLRHLGLDNPNPRTQP